jgi:cation-transporting ATPase E
MDQAQPRGLTSAEVAERIRQGEVNRTPRSDWRDYANIVARNVLTWFNAMVTPAAVALFLLGEYQGAIAVSGMAIVNSTLGLAQELRAKRHLDKLAIMVETRARVVRDGQTQQIPAGDVVLGDHILLASGETIIADGPILDANFLEVDEALLTGESDPVRRQPGDQLLSGSFCVAGEGAYRADKVGGEAFANATSAQARSYAFVTSPLTDVINYLIKLLTYTAVGLTLLYTIAYVIQGFPKSIEQEREYVRMIAATITSMVPQGMVLTATISFTLGAIVMSRRGAIVQRLNAVETMAAVDVVCTDKTGTLTTNRLKLDQIRLLPVGLSEEEVRRRLRLFAAASVDRQNKNLQAIRAALGETSATLLDQLPFKSQNRYSAVRIRDGDDERVLVMGACEALRPFLAAPEPAWETVWNELLPTGLRILMFAQAQRPEKGFDSFGGTLDGFALEPLALVCLSDELRPEAGQVLEALAAQGIAFKVISGDNPQTVKATVAHLNLPLAREPVISGDQLAKASDRAELIRTGSVFGRVVPAQKVEIVDTLKSQGRHVAMIGDGVNDVLPIKRADLGIAMGEGSQATKTVAGLVLENNNFALLPETLEEGRTIIRNLRRSGKLFLVKNVYSLILILAYYSGWFGLPFPYVPQQVTLLNWLVIGIPALVIALSRERSKAATRPNFLREVGWFAIRTGVVFGLAGLTILLLADQLLSLEEEAQRTMLLSVLILLGITALFRALKDGEPESLVGDTRFRLLGLFAIPAYLLVMYWEFSAWFFELTPLTWAQWLLVVVVAAAGYGLSLLTDRIRL